MISIVSAADLSPAELQDVCGRELVNLVMTGEVTATECSHCEGFGYVEDFEDGCTYLDPYGQRVRLAETRECGPCGGRGRIVRRVGVAS